MTVNVYTGPGTSSYASSLYTATVNGSAAYVYSRERTTALASEVWTAGQSVELSWVKFTANETATVAITRIAGAITSYVVYPKNVATATLAGGVLSLSVPTNTRLRVEINGDRAEVLHVFSEPLPRTVGTVTDWSTLPKTVSSINTGTNVVTMSASHGWSAGQRVILSTTGTLPSVGSGAALSVHEAVYVLSPSGADLQLARTAGGAAIDLSSSGTGTLTITRADWTSGALYFGTGVHTIGRGFKLSAGTRVYIDANAVVRGSFDWRGISGTGPIVEGPGTLTGEFSTSETVQLLSTFAEKIEHCMFLGYDASQFNYNTEVQGITVVLTPFYGDYVAVNRYINVQFISPWYYECNGLQVCPKSSTEQSGSITDCFSFSGDDNLTLGEQVSAFSFAVSGCFLCCSANSNIHLNYWSQPNYGYASTVDDTDFLHIGIADNEGNSPFPVNGGNCHIKAWADGYVGDEQYGRFNITFTDIRVWGPHASRLLMLANRDYPFDDYDDAQTRDQRGQIANFVFDGLTVETAPEQLSLIYGYDWLSTPHDIAFLRWTVDGELVTTTNYTDYLTIGNSYPFNITFGGKPVVTSVDICNRALDLIGHQKRITALGPADGSAEALTCNDHYTSAVNELLELREWNFATVKRELEALDESDDPAYDYAYEVPEGMLKAIALLEDGASDNYLRNGFEVAPQNYEMHADEDGVVRIYSDTADAWLRFTKYVTDPNLFSPQFLNALYWLLASKIAGAIIKGAEGGRERDRCLQMFAMALGEAAKVDAVQQKRPVETPIATWQRRGRIQ